MQCSGSFASQFKPEQIMFWIVIEADLSPITYVMRAFTIQWLRLFAFSSGLKDCVQWKSWRTMKHSSAYYLVCCVCVVVISRCRVSDLWCAQAGAWHSLSVVSSCA